MSDELLKRIEQLSSEKRELLAMLMQKEGIARQTIYVAPRTPVEEVLATIWSQVLGIPQVGIYDNFLELGGDSIGSIQVVAKAYEAGLKFTTNQLFEYLTIAELAMIVETIAVAQEELPPNTHFVSTDTLNFKPSDFPEAELTQEELNKLFMNNNK
ncbi:MAG: phosphopantetheine-binding protein [Nostoc sp. ChiSLP01]|nr:phosphopantetheine-binding protein [Nostoc sp. DedQUE12b]MDZ8087067.1 phosphopantetheine-binding protein [Nostoc sp. DedQUE12b]MDZ8168546.1 phosphopantetheine-binding protein [Nostoc sp. CmiSLP01]MDZ8288662.1 phosphopantetheine-binding protein [Nostoc sp. ChiSLP01]